MYHGHDNQEGSETCRQEDGRKVGSKAGSQEGNGKASR
jgi:hypothetical protein